MRKVLSTIRRLRGANGCPWDKKQTFKSLKRCLLEESFEAIDAIEREDHAGLKEELGDLLCVISMLADMGEKKRLFKFRDITNGLVKKLVRRHPHVFGTHKVSNADEALESWTKIKLSERVNGKPKRWEDASRNFPSLLASQKIGKRVARLGFDWDNTGGVFLKIREEMKELEESMKRGKRSSIEEEIGDLLFSVAQLCRKSKSDAELILHRANSKFIKRFNRLETIAKREGRSSLKGMSAHELDKLWKRAKRTGARK